MCAPKAGTGAGAGWIQEIDVEQNSQERLLESAISELSIKERAGERDHRR